MPILNNTYFEDYALELLAAAKLNKAQFAERMGVARQNIQKVFETKNIITLQRAADVLGVPLNYLLFGTKEASICGYIEINDTVYSIKTINDFVQLIDKVEGIVHLPSFNRQDKHKIAIKEFILKSMETQQDGAMMSRYGLNEIFTLSYDAQSEKFSLALCVGDANIQFKIYDIKDYKNDENVVEIYRLLEAIVTMVDDIVSQ